MGVGPGVPWDGREPDPGMRLRCLGGLEVRSGGHWRGVGGGKVRAVLGVLLVHVGQHVPVRQLVDEVWPAAAPPSAPSLVRGYVLALRRTIGADGRALVPGHASGYRLAVDRSAIDASRFEELVADGRAALRRGEVDRCARALREALALWRGPALADVPRTPSVSAYAARLDELRLVALESRIEADLRRGRSEELLGELRQLVAEHPGRERFVVLWMRALHAAGRRADALTAYVTARRRLAEEFGIEPGVELRRVHHEILNADRAGAGPPPLPDAPAPPWQVPIDLADFTGRDAESARCLAILSGGTGVPADAAADPGRSTPRLVAISGRAGVGKTALAVHLAHRLRAAYPDGQLYADLAGDTDHPASPGTVLGTFLRALGIPGTAVPEGCQERAALFRSVLAGRRLLVVLDNAADERQVRPLLPGDSGCGVLLTGRTRLSAIAGCHFVDLDVFPPVAALALVEKIVGAARVAAEPSSAAALVDLCGHLPLAVRIAAARAAASPDAPLAWLVAQLTDERRRLDELRIGDLDVRSSIATGYAALGEDERRVLCRLALLDAADVAEWTVAAVADLPAAAAQRAVRTLVDRRLLDEAGVDHCGQMRYRFHGLIKLFARERADEEPAEARAAAVERALVGWLALARLADRSLPTRALAPVGRALPAASVPDEVASVAARAPFDWFEAERAALTATVTQAAAAGRADLAWQLAAAAHGCYELRALHDDGQRTHDLALRACAAAGDRLGEAVMHRNLAGLYSSRPGSTIDAKLSHARAALRLFRQVGHRPGEADALYLCATVHRTRGRNPAAVRLLEASRRVAEAAGYRLGELHVWQELSIVRRQQGRAGQALADAERALRIARELGSARDQSVALGIIGIVHRDRSDRIRAEAALAEAVAIATRTGDSLQLAFLYGHLGALYVDSGDPAARPVLERGLLLSSTCGSVFGRALALLALGRLDLSTGEPARAAARLEEAATLYRQSQNSYAEAKALAGLARALAALGERGRAEEVSCAAAHLFRQLGNEAEAAELAAAVAVPGVEIP